MALLRFPCCPSTIYLPTDQHQFHKTPLPTFQKSLIQSNLTKNKKKNPTFSWCLSHSNARAYPLPIEPKRSGLFRCHVATQHPVVDSPLANVSAETRKLESGEADVSRTRLIAMNVPWTSTIEDIRGLFEKYGTVLNIEASMHNKTKNRGLVFVTMGSPEEARAARNNLEAYEFEGRKLKLNYARPKKKPAPPASRLVPTFNLFVSNLPFDANVTNLREFLSAESCNFISAKVVHNDNPGKSTGYGFVSFKTKKEADTALYILDGKMFMGRTIIVARCKQFVKPLTKESLQSSDASTELNSGAEQADSAVKD